MNRKFKFRAWCQTGKRLAYSDDFTGEGVEHWDLSEFFEYLSSGDIIQQFTGLGNIYEGDIVKDGEGFLYTVFWLDTTASFELAPVKELPDDYDEPIFNFPNYFQLEVVGNIFENSELLK
jgi:hypothetical protein